MILYVRPVVVAENGNIRAHNSSIPIIALLKHKFDSGDK